MRQLVASCAALRALSAAVFALIAALAASSHLL